MQLNLSEEEISKLRSYQKQTKDKVIYTKVTCILMLGMEIPVITTAISLGIDESTVYRYAKSYLSVGLSVFLDTDYSGYFGKLTSNEIGCLCSELNRVIYTSCNEISVFIKDRFGVDYSLSGVRDLLHRIGFTYKKTKAVPCESSIEKQLEFVSEISKIFSEQDEKTVIYYADGVHPTHNSRSTYGWIEKGKEFEQPTVSGRDRVNINGIVNARDVTDIIAIDSVSINAQSTKELYQLAIEKHPEAEQIIIISDNAKYYKNRELKEWIKGTKITQLFLPPYSPNLNLIERLWRFLRRKIIDTKFYRKKEDFRDAILTFFKNIGRYKSELETLLTLNFRLVNSQSISF